MITIEKIYFVIESFPKSRRPLREVGNFDTESEAIQACKTKNYHAFQIDIELSYEEKTKIQSDQPLNLDVKLKNFQPIHNDPFLAMKGTND